MTANKHTPGTPGPWVPVALDDGSWVIDNGFGYPVAVVQNVGRQIGSRDTEEDARKLAAAPDLLEALSAKVNDAEQRVFEDWLESKSPSGDHEQVQRHWLESSDYRDFVAEWGDQLAAIAKATGGAA